MNPFSMEMRLRPEQVVELFDSMADELLVTLNQGKLLPTMTAMSHFEHAMQHLPRPLAEHVSYRAQGLNSRVLGIVNQANVDLSLHVFPHPFYEQVVYAPSARIFVPSQHGYDSIRFTVNQEGNRDGVAPDSFLFERHAFDSAERVEQEATRVFNVTGGVLHPRHKPLDEPVRGYDLEETLAPIAARKYLHRLANPE